MSDAHAFAGILLILLGLVHTVLGERLVFRSISKGGPHYDAALALLTERRWRAIRSSWHLVTLLSIGFGIILFGALRPFVVIAGTTGVAALYWVVGTRGKHPAWIVLLLISGLLAFNG